MSQVRGSGSTIWNDRLYESTDLLGGIVDTNVNPFIDPTDSTTFVTDTTGRKLEEGDQPCSLCFWVVILVIAGIIWFGRKAV